MTLTIKDRLYTAEQRGSVTVLKPDDAGDDLFKVYHVYWERGVPIRCTCPDAVYRNRECKHLLAVKAAHGVS